MVKKIPNNDGKEVSNSQEADKSVQVKEKVSKKRKIAILSDDVDFVRGKKATQSESKPLKIESDNIFVSSLSITYYKYPCIVLKSSRWYSNCCSKSFA